MKYETCIKKYGKKTNLWYIDIKGKDQTNRDVWLSGNVLDQGQCGYGGFYDYATVKEIFDNIEKVIAIQLEDLRHASRDGVFNFTPKRVYLGYAPLNLKEDNVLWESRLINL